MNLINTSAQKFLDGQVISIKKPINWTSFDVVKKIRNSIKKKFNLKKIKVGHAGTLDPLATGLLIVCTGKFTKKINEIQKKNKVYIGEIVLGATTPSYDLETPINMKYNTEHITEEMIYNNCINFEGKLMQKPPIYSAIKKSGERLYKKARRGETIEIKSREIEIISFNILTINLPNIKVKINCSKGTYIRSIANDFGKLLNSGAYLGKLERTQIGCYKLNQAITVEEFISKLNHT